MLTSTLFFVGKEASLDGRYPNEGDGTAAIFQTLLGCGHLVNEKVGGTKYSMMALENHLSTKLCMTLNMDGH